MHIPMIVSQRLQMKMSEISVAEAYSKKYKLMDPPIERHVKFVDCISASIPWELRW